VRFSDNFICPPVEIAAHLSAPLIAYLRRVVGEGHEVVLARGWTELDAVIRSRAVDLVVIEPWADGGADLAPVYALMARYPTLPVVVYAALSPEMLRSTVELARHGVRHVVLRGFDDEPRRFRELLEGLPAHRLAEQALSTIAADLAVGMPLLQRALARMYEAPHTITGVESLAKVSGMTRRSLDRWLEKLGLASARMLIFTARLAQAYHYLGEDGFRLEDITKKLGYSSPRNFSRQVRATMGLPPSELRERMPPDQFMAALTAMMRRRGATDGGKKRRARADPRGGR
jgi:AraC-like DNA-binding protein